MEECHRELKANKNKKAENCRDDEGNITEEHYRELKANQRRAPARKGGEHTEKRCHRDGDETRQKSVIANEKRINRKTLLIAT